MHRTQETPRHQMASNDFDSSEEKKFERHDESRGREHKVVKVKDKPEDTDLPHPPPDPWTVNSNLDRSQSHQNSQPRSLGEEEDIIAYLSGLRTPPLEGQTSECPSRNSATSTMAVTSLCTEEAFEHLDRLYSLTEQILELRDRSSRLFRTVRDLERLKAQRNADRRAERAILSEEDLKNEFPEEDAGFAESLLDAMLSNGRDPQHQRRNVRSPSARQRSRSLGLSETAPQRPANLKSDLEKRVGADGNSGAPKVSKWTRVKAAFKWERACTNDVVDVIDLNVTTPSTPTTKYLRIPEMGPGSWSGSTLSPSTSEMSGATSPGPGRISSMSSSNEDVFDGPRKGTSIHSERQLPKVKDERSKDEPERRSRSCEDESSTSNHVDTERPAEVNLGKPLIRIISEANSCTTSQFSKTSVNGSEKDVEDSPKRPTPILTITIPSNEEEFRNVSSPESISPLPSSALDSGECSPQRAKIRQENANVREYRRQRSAMEESATTRPKMQRQDSKWNKVRRAFLTNTAFSVPPSPVRVIAGQSFLQDYAGTPRARSCSGSVEDLEKSMMSNAQMETRRDYQALREKLGAEFHRKLVEWERIKNSSPRGSARNARDVPGTPLIRRDNMPLGEDRLAPEFKKKLQEWKRAKKGRRSSASIERQRVSRRRLTDWQLWRSPSKPDARNQDMSGPRGSCGSVGSAGSATSDGKPHLCEEFVRQMEAWRRVNEAAYRNAESRRPSSSRLGTDSVIDESEFIPLEKVMLACNGGRDRRDDDRRRGDKYTGEESKFASVPQTINTGKEILIRTSCGSYRFEGISREFTRKLYDWERYRGISPRSSTFRLLGPGYAPFAEANDDLSPSTPPPSAEEEKMFHGTLKRSKSAGSLIEGKLREETFTRRSTSLQSLTHLAEKLNDADRIEPSPATSEQPLFDAQQADAADPILDDSEPEAVIVDIEDVIEETASPLERVQPHQTPVYSVAASETTSIAVPLGTVTSSHEPSPVILMEAEESADRWEARLKVQRDERRSNEDERWSSADWSSILNRREESPDVERWDASRSWIGRTDSSSLDSPGPGPEMFVKRLGTSGERLMESWQQDYSSQDDDSIKSYHSVRSADWMRGRGGVQEGSSDLNSSREIFAPDFFATTSNSEATDEIAAKREWPEIMKHEIKKEQSETEYGNLFTKMPDNMDLPSENRAENESVEANQEEDKGKSFVDDDGDQDERKDEVRNGPHDAVSDDASSSPQFGTSQPVTDHVDATLSAVNLSTDAALADNKSEPISATYSLTAETDDPEVHYEDYATIGPDVQIRQFREYSNVTPDPHEYEHIGPFNTLPNRTHDFKARQKFSTGEQFHSLPSRTEGNEAQNARRSRLFETSASSNGLFNQLTIATTPINVSSYPEPQCYERILINEATLNKIVVPTSSTTARSSVDSSTTNSQISVNSNSNDHEDEAEDKRGNGSRDSSIRRSAELSKKVFVKTKRVIFSPFRRSEDRQQPSRKSSEESSRSLTKSKSKSRSSSPKLCRQDAIRRLPLSLPWPLRPSSKERESNHFAHSKSSEQAEKFIKIDESPLVQDRLNNCGANSEDSRTQSSVDLRRPSFDFRLGRVCQEAKDDSLPKFSGQSDRMESVSFYQGQVEVPEREDSSNCDTLPADLMHKLRILSNAAAKRDGRLSTISVDSLPESRASRIRRAKESFLARRGGPFCQSVFETSSSEPTSLTSSRLSPTSRESSMLNARSAVLARREASLTPNLALPSTSSVWSNSTSLNLSDSTGSRFANSGHTSLFNVGSLTLSSSNDIGSSSQFNVTSSSSHTVLSNSVNRISNRRNVFSTESTNVMSSNSTSSVSLNSPSLSILNRQVFTPSTESSNGNQERTERSSSADHVLKTIPEKSSTSRDTLGSAEENCVSNDAQNCSHGALSKYQNPNSESQLSLAEASNRSDLVKSASAGMINVDPNTFGRLATSSRGCESLPRSNSKRSDSSGPFARIVNKFKLSRLMHRGHQEETNMRTISTLCRQSLFINVQPDVQEQEAEQEDGEEVNNVDPLRNSEEEERRKETRKK